MNVQRDKVLSASHKIEYGAATWDASSKSIRNRYATSSGGFSPRSSSEIPLDDIIEIIDFVFEHDLLNQSDCADIIKMAADSLKRQCK